MNYRKLTEHKDWRLMTGAHRVGGIDYMTCEEMVQLLGEPNARNGDKTSMEWWLQFEGGTVATIYDYDESLPWSIGGHRQIAAAMVHSLLASIAREKETD